MEVTIGGDRIGSGNKNKLHLHGYERSTHNQSQRFTSTMGAGMLIPCLCMPTLRGDVYDIDINAACRTLPTKSPLFSTFKMQVDIYHGAVRLYQGILHNNPLFIGLKMSQVMFPQLVLKTIHVANRYGSGKIADNALLKYLGLSGMGKSQGSTDAYYTRKINAIPPLLYYDIYKNFYANKQEDNAYIISSNPQLLNYDYMSIFEASEYDETKEESADVTISVQKYNANDVEYDRACVLHLFAEEGATVTMHTLTPNLSKFYVEWMPSTTVNWRGTLQQALAAGIITGANFSPIQNTDMQILSIYGTTGDKIILHWKEDAARYEDKLEIIPFALTNIDDMRLALLSHHTLGTPYVINDFTWSGKEPYNSLVGYDSNGITKNGKALNGIALKTYQADIYNAWVNTEWIDGENGIAEMSKIAVSDGSVYMDALLLAEKTYNMLNRVAVAGGTYEAWQDVVYTETTRRHIESPIYCGGLSNEIVFEEIVQTTPTDSAPLGTLGGRGIAVKRKGGHVSVKCDEAGFLMGIVSITPRVYYTQGNEFYLTELLSMDDMHKPAMDGIGFQDLIGERMCWTDTTLNADGSAIVSRTRVGKLPAWIEYMTAVDKAYGEFCDLNKQGSMILGRHYETNSIGEVQDFTTYIDPSKYNYVFGDKSLTAQNFWVQIDFNIKSRKLMSAKQIPNL